MDGEMIRCLFADASAAKARVSVIDRPRLKTKGFVWLLSAAICAFSVKEFFFPLFGTGSELVGGVA
jgi:hypothetical protein